MADKEFDKKSETKANTSLKWEDIEDLLSLDTEKVTLSLSVEMIQKLNIIARRINLNLEDTIKVLLAKELGMI